MKLLRNEAYSRLGGLGSNYCRVVCVISSISRWLAPGNVCIPCPSVLLSRLQAVVRPFASIEPSSPALDCSRVPRRVDFSLLAAASRLGNSAVLAENALMRAGRMGFLSALFFIYLNYSLLICSLTAMARL